MSHPPLQAHLDPAGEALDDPSAFLLRDRSYGCCYLKDRVYEDNPQTIPALKAAITAAIRAIPREECGRVIENFARRIQVWRGGGGAHLEHILKRQ